MIKQSAGPTLKGGLTAVLFAALLLWYEGARAEEGIGRDCGREDAQGRVAHKIGGQTLWLVPGEVARVPPDHPRRLGRGKLVDLRFSPERRQRLIEAIGAGPLELSISDRPAMALFDNPLNARRPIVPPTMIADAFQATAMTERSSATGYAAFGSDRQGQFAVSCTGGDPLAAPITRWTDGILDTAAGCTVRHSIGAPDSRLTLELRLLVSDAEEIVQAIQWLRGCTSRMLAP